MNPEEWISITEAAKQLGVSRGSIYEAINAGKIRTVTVLGRQAVHREDVAAYTPRGYVGRRESARPDGVKGPGGRPRKMQDPTP